jgi:hypothetical protein
MPLVKKFIILHKHKNQKPKNKKSKTKNRTIHPCKGGGHPQGGISSGRHKLREEEGLKRQPPTE